MSGAISRQQSAISNQLSATSHDDSEQHDDGEEHCDSGWVMPALRLALCSGTSGAKAMDEGR
ncbi:MAG: hypothetical protein U9R79_01230 [Armatimonadota bacterium]|nr:hypothetical protein [Armatimonadota bacterium]